MSFEYISGSKALEEAQARLSDRSLQEKVAAYLGNVWPASFDERTQPVAVFAPYLAKGSQVEVEFLRRAHECGFKTCVATYGATEYVTANPAVVDCYRPPLMLPKGQRSRNWVVPEAQRRGQLENAETTYEGLSIVNYWYGIRSNVLEEARLPVEDTVVDFGSWYGLQAKRFGWQETERSKSSYYYMALMGLYASGRAVLFDTPATAFATKVMEPAADIAMTALGVKPLITCELVPQKRDWVDLTYLDDKQVERLQTVGRV